MGVFAPVDMLGVEEAEGMIEKFIGMLEEGGDSLLSLREKRVFEN